jgi:hypothetical protein
MEVIALATYLGNYRFVTPIIAFRFLQDVRPFLLRAIRANNSNPIPFQVHLKWVHDLLLPTTQVFIPPFEQLSDRGTYFL